LLRLLARFINTLLRRLAEKKVQKNPNVHIDKSARILSYEGIYCENGVLKIGKNVFVNVLCIIGTISSKITIGDNSLIGFGTIINTSHHNFERTDIPIRNQGLHGNPIVIEEDVWIGAHCTILGGTRIGAHSVIGAHSLVKGDIPPYSVAYGVPCKVHRSRIQTRNSEVQAKPIELVIES
jgi:galactoside O-acetyltransferase